VRARHCGPLAELEIQRHAQRYNVVPCRLRPNGIRQIWPSRICLRVPINRGASEANRSRSLNGDTGQIQPFGREPP